MSTEKQIEEMACAMCVVKHICNEPNKPIKTCYALKCAERAYEAGYRKQEWISVEDKLPETKPQTITFKDVEIGGGGETTFLGTEERVEAQVSDSVLIISEHPKGTYYDIDQRVDGSWANNWWVTHWFPLPPFPESAEEPKTAIENIKKKQKQFVEENAEKYGYRKQSEWISVDERLPKPYMSVLVYMPGEAPHPTVREGFLTKHGAWYAGGFDRLPDEVVMWKEMPEPPKMKGGAE